METIIQGDKHASCRLCDGIVYANNPVCRKCGLPMSFEGVVESSGVRDNYVEAINQLHHIKQISIFFIGFTPIGFVASYLLGIFFFFDLYFGLGAFSVFFGLMGWHRKYSKIEFSNEDFQLIKKYKKIAWMCLLVNLFVGFSLLFILKSWLS
jgi:hypothetical protein